METIIREIEERITRLRTLLSTMTQVFITEDEYEDNDDIIYELPRVGRVTKHGYYIEYVVTSISSGVVHGKGIGDDYGDEEDFDFEDLTYGEIIAIADELVTLTH